MVSHIFSRLVKPDLIQYHESHPHGDIYPLESPEPRKYFRTDGNGKYNDEIVKSEILRQTCGDRHHQQDKEEKAG